MIQAWYEFGCFSLMNYIDFLCRILCAAFCGGLIGLERERRFKNAGLRTHIIVSMAAAVMMIISKYAFFDIVILTDYKIQVDAARVAAGVVQAIGFLGAGIIFVRKESVVGLTTAAGLWATVGIGLALGAGFYTLGIAATLLILGMQALLHFKHSRSHSQNAGSITCDVEKHNMKPSEVPAKLKELGAIVKSMSIKKTAQGREIVASVVFEEKLTIEEICEKTSQADFIDAMDIYPVF